MFVTPEAFVLLKTKSKLNYVRKISFYLKEKSLVLITKNSRSLFFRDFHSKINQMHYTSNLFLFSNNTLHVLNGLSVHHQESKTVRTASACYQAATEPVRHVPDAACTVLDFRNVRILNSDAGELPRRKHTTCRVLFQNKINLRYCASGWFYHGSTLRCMFLQTSKKFFTDLNFVSWENQTELFDPFATTNVTFWYH
jgi:hypothetical protein